MDKIHINNAPSLNTECLIHALDRLTCLDHYFSNNSREYLIKHVRNKDELHMPNSVAVNLNIGLCGQINSRLYISRINESEIENFMEYILWRFFDNTNYPVPGQISDFSKEVQQAMDKTMASFSPVTINYYEEHPEALIYYWHQSFCSYYFPLRQYDSKSPYGANRLKLLKNMIRTLTEIRSYAVKIQTEGEIKWPVTGSVIAPNELINKEK